MDTIGRVANALSTPGQLQLMTWVAGYQSTLRGLGVQEVRGVRTNSGLGRKGLADMQTTVCATSSFVHHAF